MTAESFRHCFRNIPEATLLLSSDGVILEANIAAQGLLPLNGSPTALGSLLADTPDKVSRLIKTFSRSRDFLPGSVLLKDAAGERPCRIEGAVFNPEYKTLILRLFANDRSTQRFQALNERIEALNREVSRRRRAETTLHAQSEWLRATLVSIGDAVIATDVQGKITFLNPVAQSLTGWNQEDAQGLALGRVFVIASEKSGEPVENPVDRVIREGNAVGLVNHTKLVTRTGREVPIDDSAAPIRDANGALSGVVLVFRDITARREAEASMEQSIAYFRLMADNAPVLIWIAGLDRLCTWLNKPWLDFVGRSLEQDIGNGWLENIHPDDYDRCSKAYTSAFDARQTVSLEYRLRRHDGEYRWILDTGTPLYKANGDFMGYIGSCIDITERRQLEEALRNSERIYRGIGESIQYGVWICTPDGRNIYASESFLQFVGLTQEQISDFGWGDVLHPDDAERTIAAWKECVRTGGVWSIEHRFRGTDGQYHWVLARGVPVRDEYGNVTCWAGINLDIDQVKSGEENLRANEQDLRMANEALRRANADLNQFAFAASHDLQEPLRMVTSYSQLLLKATREGRDAEASMCVNVISEGTERMRELLDDLLSYTQINVDGQATLRLVNLDEVMQKTVENLKVSIAESGALVSADRLPSILGHEVHFIQLFQNLIENAIKYRGKAVPMIRVSAVIKDGVWQIGVSDNGIGINPIYHQRVFGVFKRLHGRSIPGTGIGLAICQRVVERYGGRIWVESEVEQGATFFFTLPSARMVEE